MGTRRTVQKKRRSTSLLLVAYLTLAIFGIPAFAGAIKPDDPGAQGQGHGQGQGGPNATPTATPTATAPTPTASLPPTGDVSTPTTPSAPQTAPTPPEDDPAEDPAIDAEGASSGPSGSTHPPGNNGTVKIDGQPWDNDPNNEPHVGCEFQLDFYGYDDGRGLVGEYLFELWSPTGSGELVTGSTAIGEDPAGGGTDHDASVTIDLKDEVLGSGSDPHPNQGWHVRLTVNADGSIGADVKHKMFWVTCAPSPGPSTPPETPSEGPTTVKPPTTPNTHSPTVMSTTVRPPTNLAFTGSGLGTLVAAAAILLVIGTAALRLSARPQLIGRHRRR
jgi:hypothetical protein